MNSTKSSKAEERSQEALRLRAWRVRERRRCTEDPEYFITNYCVVESDTGQGVIPFHLFDYQKTTLYSWMEHRECITLKARQLGISELAAALALWQVNFHPYNKVIVISHDEAHAKEFAKKCLIAWRNLPHWLAVSLSNPRLTTTIELVNGSRILPEAATEKAARGFNCQLLILDEFAFQEYGRVIFEASAVTARSAGNRILIISTANGSGDAFHTYWQAAVNKEPYAMFPIFLPWDVRPGRTEEWYNEVTHGYDVAKKNQEYPFSAESAFALSGRSRFDTPALLKIMETCTSPMTAEWDDALKIWEYPRRDGRYVIGADTAQGLEHGDYSTAVVLDFDTGLDVATVHVHAEPKAFAAMLSTLAMWYNNAYLGVERNNHGATVLMELTTTQGYGNLYYHQEYNAPQGTDKPGWPTSPVTKPLMIDTLAVCILDGRPYRNSAIMGECRTYVTKPNGDTAASGTNHDDLVIALAIAEMMRRYRPPEEVVEHLEDIAPIRVRIGSD